MDFWVQPQVKKTKCRVANESLPKPKKVIPRWRRLDSNSVIHKEALFQGQKVNSKICVKIHEWLRKSMERVRKEIFTKWMLHHDNTLSCNTFHKVTARPQPSYSPDVPQSDFFLFSRVKRSLKSNHCGTLDNAKENVTRCLKFPSISFRKHIVTSRVAGNGVSMHKSAILYFDLH